MDGSDASTSNDKAEALNEFFSSVFIEDSTEVSDFPKDSYLGEFLDSFEITSEMVEEKLRGLSANKSPGPDGWHPIFLKNIKDLISFPLATLFQKSLNEGIVTSQWLEAYISPIYQKGNMCENYRPVSLTSVLCKLMESIIRDKLLEHTRKNDIISNKQHGFVPFGSCMSNLLLYIEMLSEMLEANCSIDVIYTDFAKAFDCVSHAKLLQKIKSVGIVGNMDKIIFERQITKSPSGRCILVFRQSKIWNSTRFGPWTYSLHNMC